MNKQDSRSAPLTGIIVGLPQSGKTLSSVMAQFERINRKETKKMKKTIYYGNTLALVSHERDGGMLIRDDAALAAFLRGPESIGLVHAGSEDGTLLRFPALSSQGVILRAA